MKRFLPLRFSLRTLLIGLGISSALLGVWAAERERCAAELRICRRLVERLGGNSDRILFGPLSCGKQRKDENTGGLAFDAEFDRSWKAALYPGGLRTVVRLGMTPKANEVNRQEWRAVVLPEIVKLRSLESVSIQTEHIVSEDLATLEHLPVLTSLYLDGDWIDDAALEQVGKLRRLERLGVRPGLGNAAAALDRLSDRGLAQLSKLTALTDLSLVGVAIDTDVLGELHGLIRLDLADCELSPQACQGLARCTRLESVDLSGTRPCDSYLAAALAALPCLKAVDIQGEVRESSLVGLSASRSLESLGLWDCGHVTERGWAAVAKLPLEELYFSGVFRGCRTGFDRRAFAHLENMKSLRVLWGEARPLSDNDLALLARMTNLTHINLGPACGCAGEPLSSEQLASLRRLMPTTIINENAGCGYCSFFIPEQAPAASGDSGNVAETNR